MKWVPLKVQFFVRMAAQDRILSLENLVHIKLYKGDKVNCERYGEGIEDTKHLLFECNISC